MNYIKVSQNMVLHFKKISLSGLGGGQFKPPPYRFFAITQKVFELRNSNFLAFLTNTCP